MKTIYQYEYKFTFKSGNTLSKKAYYKDIEDAVKTILKRVKKLKNLENVESFEIKWTGNSIII